ncbi:MAG: pilus assembly protein [Candidatus Sericytochromatia bacterium]|nr:pilus assembly protein [Candidatus Tanganyikabacteria bacterium]
MLRLSASAGPAAAAGRGRAIRKRGQAVVETALAIPVLMAMVWGIMGFGRLYTAQLAITNASREGARLGALGKPVLRIEDAVRQYLGGAAIAGDVRVAVQGVGGQAGDLVRVAVTAPVSNPVPVPGLPPSIPLSATTVMRIE